MVISVNEKPMTKEEERMLWGGGMIECPNRYCEQGTDYSDGEPDKCRICNGSGEVDADDECEDCGNTYGECEC